MEYAVSPYVRAVARGAGAAVYHSLLGNLAVLDGPAVDLLNSFRPRRSAEKAIREQPRGRQNAARAAVAEFARRGFHIRAVFDSHPRKIGRKMGACIVESMDTLPLRIRELGIDISVIAVPPRAAQRVADILIASGVRGLLNLTLTHIMAPQRVAVVDARIVASLLELAHAIKDGDEAAASPR